MLPKINGYELLDYVNSIGIPAIFLTAKATIKDKVYGLRLGAEDYIIKPFDVSELLARVEVVLRRYHKKEELLSFHDIIIDCQKKTVLKNDTLLNLTPKEFDLMLYLIERIDKIVTREELLKLFWNSSMSNSRSIDMHIKAIRQKIFSKTNLEIITLLKVGYKLTRR
jgi:DNA-binding response OmpR family regulator